MKYIARIAVTLLCAALLAACGKPKPNDAPPPSPEPGQTDQAQTEGAQTAAPEGAFMTFHGDPVSAEEFRLFMLIAQTDDKADAREFLVYALTVLDKAAELGVTLSDEDAQAVADYANQLASLTEATGDTPAYFDPFDIPEDRLLRLLSASVFANRLYEYYTDDINIDEEAFEQAFAKYLENGKAYYMEVLFQYILVDDEEEAQAALAALDEGMDFEEAVRTFSEDYDEEYGVETKDLRDISATEEFSAALLALDVGAHSAALPLNDYFIIARVTTSQAPPEADVRADFRVGYTDNERYNTYYALVDEWLAAAVYTVDEAQMEAFEMH